MSRNWPIRAREKMFRCFTSAHRSESNFSRNRFLHTCWWQMPSTSVHSGMEKVASKVLFFSKILLCDNYFQLWIKRIQNKATDWYDFILRTLFLLYGHFCFFVAKHRKCSDFNDFFHALNLLSIRMVNYAEWPFKVRSPCYRRAKWLRTSEPEWLRSND